LIFYSVNALKEMAECGVCKKPATNRCSKCKTVSYCSREHQKEDWKSHCTICHKTQNGTGIPEDNQPEKEKESLPGPSGVMESVPYVLKPTEYGLCMVASRDLKPGDFIYSEVPGKLQLASDIFIHKLPILFIYITYFYFVTFEETLCPILRLCNEDYQSVSPCYGCFTTLQVGQGAVYRCTKCGVPLCSTDCENAIIHKRNECQALRQMKVVSSYELMLRSFEITL
jgi:hypothetical protein